MTAQEILDAHQQLRRNTCFQMAPELALKLVGILESNLYPFQDRVDWDGKGYEPFAVPHIVGAHSVQFEQQQYLYPYDGMKERLRKEISAGTFPILSLVAQGQTAWHGYVGVAPLGESDILLLSKGGSLESQCISIHASLDSCTWNQLKVDCLFWRATTHMNENPNASV